MTNVSRFDDQYNSVITEPEAEFYVILTFTKVTTCDIQCLR